MNFELKPEFGHLHFQDIALHDINATTLISYGTRCSLYYGHLAASSEIGKKIQAELDLDKRLSSDTNRFIWIGNNGGPVDARNLTMWLLRRANSVGLEEAWRNVNSFLDSDSVRFTSAYWVQGLLVETSIDLGEGYYLQPVSDMPNSSDKEYFTSIGRSFHESGQVMPQCAITVTSASSKKRRGNLESIVNKQVRIAALINALPEACCVPYYQTSYSPDDQPLGPFGGSGGGGSMFDVTTRGTFQLDEKHVPLLRKLIASFDRKDKAEQDRLSRILLRLSQAKRRTQIEDIILDLGIVMEMLLLGGKNVDQLSLAFRLRGSMLIAEKGHRLQVFNQLKALYSYRSQVAHTGVLANYQPKKLEQLHKELPIFFWLAEQVVQKIILNGPPDWDSLVLQESIDS